MSKIKYYAVKIGRNPGIYSTWEECSKEVIGFQNAVYKSFKTLDEAKDFIDSDVKYSAVKKDVKKIVDTIGSKINNEIELKINSLNENEAVAFVDGSFVEDENGNRKVGYGAVIITSKSKEYMSQQVFNNDYIQYRNVYGEIEASMAAIKWAINKKISRLTIYYDYEGINAWATKKWKANNDLTKAYVSFIEQIGSQIILAFVKIKSHTGITYNEVADELAGKSIS